MQKSRKASERLLESSTRYLEEKLKLTVNREKSRTVSVFAIRNFKFLGFALGRNRSGIYVRVHAKSWEKFKSKLKELSSRKRCQSIKPSLERIKVYARGWLNYYGIASMKSNMNDIKRMALSQNTYVCMETMEMCANQIPKPEGHGSSSRPRVENGKQQTRLVGLQHIQLS